MTRKRPDTDLGEGRDTTDRLALAGLWAPAVFVLGVVAAWSTWPEYSHRTQNLSDLGGTQAPQPMVMNVTFVLFGLLVVLLAIGMRRDSWSAPTVRASGLLVGVFGVAMVVQGLTPCTPGCADGTPVDTVHALTALAGCLAVVVAMVLSWRRASSRPERRWYARWSALAAIVAGVFLTAWVVASATDPEALHGGVLQRLAIAAILAWLYATATELRGAAVAASRRAASGA